MAHNPAQINTIFRQMSSNPTGSEPEAPKQLQESANPLRIALTSTAENTNNARTIKASAAGDSARRTRMASGVSNSNPATASVAATAIGCLMPRIRDVEGKFKLRTR